MRRKINQEDFSCRWKRLLDRQHNITEVDNTGSKETQRRGGKSLVPAGGSNKQGRCGGGLWRSREGRSEGRRHKGNQGKTRTQYDWPLLSLLQNSGFPWIDTKEVPRVNRRESDFRENVPKTSKAKIKGQFKDSLQRVFQLPQKYSKLY